MVEITFIILAFGAVLLAYEQGYRRGRSHLDERSQELFRHTQEFHKAVASRDVAIADAIESAEFETVRDYMVEQLRSNGKYQ